MDIRIKALIVLLPFIIAGYVGFSMLQPAMEEASTKDTSLTEKRTEKENLDGKMANSAKVGQRQVELNAAIEKLRSSVPKAPDIDLLAIDLERMCKDAGMNMVALNASKAENSGGSSSSAGSSSYLKSKQDKLKNALKGNVATPGAAAAAEAAEPEPELDQISKQFIVTGDYNGLQKLVNELESYQRVVRIDDIHFHRPKKESAKEKVKIDDTSPTDGDELGDPNNLFVSMTLTTFYLP